MNKSKFKIIFDFCDWLSEQGSAYETLYYGSEEDIVKLINMYLKEKWGVKD